MTDKVLSKLNKNEILQLPGMKQYSNQTVKELKDTLKQFIIKNFNVPNIIGWKVSTYLQQYNKTKAANQRTVDDKLFKQMKKINERAKQTEIRKQQRQQQLIQNAIEERAILNMPMQDLYLNTKNQARIAYEKRIREVQNETQFRKELAAMMKKVSN